MAQIAALEGEGPMTWLIPAVGFALLWVWVFYREDKRPEPLWMVALAFLLGIVAFGVTWCVERWVAWNWAGFNSDSPLDNAIMAFLIIGPVEEGSKFLAVRTFIYGSPHFDEPMDGIIYSAVLATGFAFAENLLLTFDARHMVWVQGLCGTLAHILFAGYWGAALGWEKSTGSKKLARIWVGISLAVSAFLHGLFDFCILTAGQTLPHLASRIALALLVAASFLILRQQISRAKKLQ